MNNDLIVIRDPAAAAKFEAHFERMWTAAVPINATTGSAFEAFGRFGSPGHLLQLFQSHKQVEEEFR
jgi:hypothetical protein